MSRGLWDQVRDIVKKGGTPSVELPKVCEVVAPKGPPGRPRVVPDGENQDFMGVMKTPMGWRMRCRAFGCSRKLKLTKAGIVCSDKCKRELLQFCLDTIAVLTEKTPPQEYPARWRVKGFDRDLSTSMAHARRRSAA